MTSSSRTPTRGFALVELSGGLVVVAFVVAIATIVFAGPTLESRAEDAFALASASPECRESPSTCLSAWSAVAAEAEPGLELYGSDSQVLCVSEAGADKAIAPTALYSETRNQMVLVGGAPITFSSQVTTGGELDVPCASIAGLSRLG